LFASLESLIVKLEMSSPQRSQSPLNHRLIYEACENSDIPNLQQLLDTSGVKKGDLPVVRRCRYSPDDDPVPASGPPPTLSMLFIAVIHKRPAVLALLLQIYPKADIRSAGLLQAAVVNQHLETFKVLHAHDPSIVNFHEFFCHESLLIKACFGGNPLIPNYLLDNGADPKYGGLGLMNCLYYAVELHQPLEVFSKMVGKGAHVSPVYITTAIRAKRPDVLAFLFRRFRFDNQMEVLRGALVEAHETKDQDIIMLIEKLIKMENRKSAEEFESVSSIKKESWHEKGAGENRKWWQKWWIR